MSTNSAAAFLTHTAITWLAIAVGAALYRRALRRTPGRQSLAASQRVVVVCGAIVGAALGSKLAFLTYDPELLRHPLGLQQLWPGGQSIVGGLLGGLAGVELAKRFAAVRVSTGDAFVVPILVAIIIGRTGCFLAGLYDGTYGNVTTVPWGYDFGDGQLRHPTQIYDQLFALGLLVLLARLRPRLAAVPGLEFKLMLSAYLLWRVLIDLLKPRPVAYFSALSGIQLLAIVALCIYLPVVLRAARPIIAGARERVPLST